MGTSHQPVQAGGNSDAADKMQRHWRLAYLQLVIAELELDRAMENSRAPRGLIDRAYLWVWGAEQRLDRIERGGPDPA